MPLPKSSPRRTSMVVGKLRQGRLDFGGPAPAAIRPIQNAWGIMGLELPAAFLGTGPTSWDGHYPEWFSRQPALRGKGDNHKPRPLYWLGGKTFYKAAKRDQFFFGRWARTEKYLERVGKKSASRPLNGGSALPGAPSLPRNEPRGIFTRHGNARSDPGRRAAGETGNSTTPTMEACVFQQTGETAFKNFHDEGHFPTGFQFSGWLGGRKGRLRPSKKKPQYERLGTA